MSVMMMVSVEVDGSGPAGRFGGKGRPGGLSLSFIYKIEENGELLLSFEEITGVFAGADKEVSGECMGRDQSPVSFFN